MNLEELLTASSLNFTEKQIIKADAYIDQILKFLVINPTKILNELGYEVPKTVNTWKKSKSVFITKSKFKNSLFENENIEIERVLSGV